MLLSAIGFEYVYSLFLLCCVAVSLIGAVMAFRIALSGFLAFVVAMGIGRFAFTPQVPLMIAEHQFTLTGAGLVAAVNYLGYLCGAFDAMRATRHLERRLWLGVWGAVVLTLLSAAVTGEVMHSVIRFMIGWTSGWAMVLVAAWCNERLMHFGRPAMSAAVFAGPGAGILLSGMLAVGIHSLQLTSAEAWSVYGVLALILIALISVNLPRKGDLHRAHVATEPLKMTPALKRLVLCYSLAGFWRRGGDWYCYRYPDPSPSDQPHASGPDTMGAGAGDLVCRSGAGRDRTGARRAAGGWRFPECGATGAAVRTRTGAQSQPLSGRIADHRLRHRSTVRADSLRDFHLLDPSP